MLVELCVLLSALSQSTILVTRLALNSVVDWTRGYSQSFTNWGHQETALLHWIGQSLKIKKLRFLDCYIDYIATLLHWPSSTLGSARQLLQNNACNEAQRTYNTKTIWNPGQAKLASECHKTMRLNTYMYTTLKWPSSIDQFNWFANFETFIKPGVWAKIYFLRKVQLQKPSIFQQINVNSSSLMSGECGVSINYGSPFPWG